MVINIASFLDTFVLLTNITINLSNEYAIAKANINGDIALFIANKKFGLLITK
jgi:hypothetical protein